MEHISKGQLVSVNSYSIVYDRPVNVWTVLDTYGIIVIRHVLSGYTAVVDKECLALVIPKEYDELMAVKNRILEYVEGDL